MLATLFSMQNPSSEDRDVKIPDMESPYTSSQSEPETADVLEFSTPSSPSPSTPSSKLAKPVNDRFNHNRTPSPRLITKHKKKRHYLTTKKSNTVILQAKLKRHNTWLKYRQRTLAQQRARQETLPELLRMPITRYVCVHCAQGVYARDEEAPDQAAQDQARESILMCQKKLGFLNTWRRGKEKQSSYAAWWWDQADDNVLKRIAFEAWKLKFKPATPTPTTATATLDLSRATPAWTRYMQECGTYICKTCSNTLGLCNNLDDSKPSYCLGCYENATRKDVLKLQAKNELRAASKAYKAARPDRGLVLTNELPQPHTLIANLRAKYLWVGGTGLKLIDKPPLNGHTYTRTEVNALLRPVRNVLMNRFSDLQLPYSLVQDKTRPAALTVAECQHHFNDHVVEIVKQAGYIIFKGKFIHRAELSQIDLNAESDDSDNSDCDLED